jgi:SulP family sulfate permease
VPDGGGCRSGRSPRPRSWRPLPIAPLAHGDPERYAVLSAGLAILVGGICLLAWLAQLGFVADLLSRPVLVSYLAGVAFRPATSCLPA